MYQLNRVSHVIELIEWARQLLVVLPYEVIGPSPTAWSITCSKILLNLLLNRIDN